MTILLILLCILRCTKNIFIFKDICLKAKLLLLLLYILELGKYNFLTYLRPSMVPLYVMALTYLKQREFTASCLHTYVAICNVRRVYMHESSCI